MPGFDRTGPRGAGAMTGGGRGFCAIPVGNRFVGRGFASGLSRPFGAFGRGRVGPGMGRRMYGGYQDYGVTGAEPFGPAMSEDQERSELQRQAQYIQGELEQIQRRISELDQ
ncbi:DUF5320 domain-containing protein [Candidatus Bipolaricaulota bacterium]